MFPAVSGTSMYKKNTSKRARIAKIIVFIIMHCHFQTHKYQRIPADDNIKTFILYSQKNLNFQQTKRQNSDPI